MSKTNTTETDGSTVSKHMLHGEALESSSELLGFSFSGLGFALAILAGCLAFTMIAYRTQFQNWLAPVNATVFAIGLFWLFRSYLPMALQVRVKDILRFRFAFLAIALSGTLTVLASPAFVTGFSTVSLNSVCLTVGILCLLIMVTFFSTKSRLSLVAAFFLCGGLCVTHAFGIVVFAGMVSLIFHVRGRCASVRRQMSLDDSYDEAYLKVMRPVFESSSTLRHSPIPYYGAFALGACALVAWHTRLSQDLVMSYIAQFGHSIISTYMAKGFILPMAAATVLAVLTYCCSRSATDITQPMKTPMTLLYGICGLFALVWPIGFINHVPPFSDMPDFADVRTQSLLPDLFAASALIVSAAVLVVDVCCRDPEELLYGHRQRNAANTTLRQRKTNAFLSTGALLLVAVFAAYRAVCR